MPDSAYVVDSSAWIEVLPSGRRGTELHQRIQQLLAMDLVATMGMIRLELLGGAKDEPEWQRLARMLIGLRQLPTDYEDWDEAAEMGFLLRRQGITVPSTDLLIAAVAIRNDSIVLHRDRHFDVLAQQTPLRVESHVTSQ